MPYKDLAKQKEFVKRYKEQHRDYLKLQAFQNRIKRTYGLSIEQLNLLKVKQDNLCKICFQNKKLVIDHCHKTGVIRGLLCFDCNIKLGQYEKFKCLIPKMQEYLNEQGELNAKVY